MAGNARLLALPPGTQTIAETILISTFGVKSKGLTGGFRQKQIRRNPSPDNHTGRYYQSNFKLDKSMSTPAAAWQSRQLSVMC